MGVVANGVTQRATTRPRPAASVAGPVLDSLTQIHMVESQGRTNRSEPNLKITEGETGSVLSPCQRPCCAELFGGTGRVYSFLFLWCFVPW